MEIKLFKLKNGRIILIFLIILVSFFVGSEQVCAFNPFSADDWFGAGIGTVLFTVSWLIYIPIYILGYLVSEALIPLMLWVANYNNFLSQAGVTQGWIVVRDLANIFIVLGILMIAFGTLFKIENYGYKKLLSKLVIAAVLINFSKFIMGILIDISQVITLTFVNAFNNIAAGNLVNAAGLGKILAMSRSLSVITGGIEVVFSLIGAMVLAIIMLVITTVVLCVIVAFFLSRVIILWLAIILSPLLFALPLVPGGQKFSSQIWDTVTKHLMTGPLLAFFLWLSFYIMSLTTAGGMSEGFDVGFFKGTEKSFHVFFSEFGSLESLLNFIVVIGLLVTSLTLASEMGVAGSKMAGEWMGKLQTAGTAAALWGPRRLWGNAKDLWNERTTKLLEAKEGKAPGFGRKLLFAALNPINAARGWEQRSKELSERTQQVATAGGREVTEQFRTRGKVRIPYREQLESSYEAAFAKDFTAMDKEQKAYMASLLYGRDNIDNKRRWRALLRATAVEGQIDDIMLDPAFIKKVRATRKGGKTYGETNEKYKFINPKTGKEEEDNIVKYNYGAVNEFFKDTLSKDQNGLRLLKELEDIGKSATHQEYGGHQGFDTEKGVWKFNEGDNALRSAKMEFNKTPGRKRFAESPHTFMELTHGYMYEEQPGGTFKRVPVVRGGKMDDFHKNAFAGTFVGDTAGHIKEHTQSRTLLMMIGGTGASSNLDKEKYAHIDANDLQRLSEYLKVSPQAIYAAYDKAGGDLGDLKFKFHNKDGNITKVMENEDDLREFLDQNIGTNFGKMDELDIKERTDNVSREFTDYFGRSKTGGKKVVKSNEDRVQGLTELRRYQQDIETIKTVQGINSEQYQKKQEDINNKRQQLASEVEPGIVSGLTSSLAQNDFSIESASIQALSDSLSQAVSDSLQTVNAGGSMNVTELTNKLNDLKNALKDDKHKKAVERVIESDNKDYGIGIISGEEAQKNFLANLRKIAQNIEEASFREEKKPKEKEK